MWTTDNRVRYDRDKLRYPSDLTDAEWALVEPLIPPAKHGGRDREVAVREVVNGIMYGLSTGCQWRYIPKDLPPKSTLYDYLVRWTDDNTLIAIHHALYLQCREMMQREPSPTACVIDSQSVKSTEKGGRNIDPSGYDAGKKIKGKKRHILVDTVGLLLHAIVHPADIQERDGGILLLSTLFGRFPFLRKLFADGGYQGPQFVAGDRQRVSAARRRDRQAVRCGWRVQGAAAPMGGRAYVRTAQSLPPSVQGFRESDPKCLGFSPPCVDPPHATKGL
jgi:putative transposase